MAKEAFTASSLLPIAGFIGGREESVKRGLYYEEVYTMTQHFTVQQLWPGNTAPGEWRTIGNASTMTGASRIARKHHDPDGFGGFRHPDGGLRYGTIRAVDGDRVLRWNPTIDTWEE